MKPVINQDKCTGCGECLNCPAGLFKKNDGKMTVIEGDCMECRYCENICPHNAITLK